MSETEKELSFRKAQVSVLEEEITELKKQNKVLMEALKFVESRSFLVENVRCPYCDEGCESATCNCGQYDSYEEILECGKRARQALADIAEEQK